MRRWYASRGLTVVTTARRSPRQIAGEVSGVEPIAAADRIPDCDERARVRRPVRNARLLEQRDPVDLAAARQLWL